MRQNLSTMSWSTSEHLQERFAALQRLASRQPNPPRNPNKPLTPFFITDILNGRVGIRNEPRTGIVRPWDDDTSSRSSSQDDGEEEIDVEDVKLPANKSVSPLDALFQMTSKTFDDTDPQHCNSGDSSKRDQLSLFSKSQPPKKRRKSRTAFTNQQIYELEKRFLYQKYLTPADRDDIAQTLGLSNAQVITWFQNRRAKLKRDLEELKADVTAASTLGENGTAVVIGSLEELEIYGRQGLKNKSDTPKSDTDIQTDSEASPS